jgi:hypothetical protein
MWSLSGLRKTKLHKERTSKTGGGGALIWSLWHEVETVIRSCDLSSFRKGLECGGVDICGGLGAQYESSISEQWEILFIKSQVDC